MSLPPHIISIKRRRDEEPVDTLYLDTKKRRSEDGDFVFRRQIAVEPIDTDRWRPRIPEIKATRPGEENGFLPPKKSRGQPVIEKNSALATPSIVAPAPRRFLLSATDRLLSPKSLLSSSPSQHRKRKTRPETDVAVFVEETKRPRTPATLNRSRSHASLAGGTSISGSADVPKHATPNESIYEDMLAHALGTDTETTSPSRRSIKPIDTDAESEFIYDTYIRQPLATAEPNHTTADQTSSPKVSALNADSTVPASHGGIGYLIINEQDNELWETFGAAEDESDEADWDSEQDDENAENYYGADYPEEEVDTDDEIDAAPYRFRQGASDDEEYGSDYEALSDGESNQFPWAQLRKFKQTKILAESSDDSEREEI